MKRRTPIGSLSPRGSPIVYLPGEFEPFPWALLLAGNIPAAVDLDLSASPITRSSRVVEPARVPPVIAFCSSHAF